jgi:hypothetical protein
MAGGQSIGVIRLRLAAAAARPLARARALLDLAAGALLVLRVFAKSDAPGDAIGSCQAADRCSIPLPFCRAWPLADAPLCQLELRWTSLSIVAPRILSRVRLSAPWSGWIAGNPGQRKSLCRKGFARNHILEQIPVAKALNFGGICSARPMISKGPPLSRGTPNSGRMACRLTRPNLRAIRRHECGLM